MNLTFWQIIGIIITTFLGIIAIKITFTFDINQYQKDREKKLSNKIKNYCTHAKIIRNNEKTLLRSTFVSPSGTSKYICEKCGLVLKYDSKSEEEARIKYYLENMKQYEKEEKEFRKLLKKSKVL